MLRRARSNVPLSTQGKRWISSLFSRLTNPAPAVAPGVASSAPPLYRAMPGVKLPPPVSDHPEAPKTLITKLPNGLTIASENSTGPSATIGLYVECGSVNEDAHNVGATQLLERMAFKSTFNRSHLRLVREFEAIGGNILASASREQLSYTGDVLKSFTPEIVELITDSVRNPVFHEWEVKEQIDILKREALEADKNPEGLLLEALHPTGYSGALGKPLVAPAAALDKMNSHILREFVSENFLASRMVLAGCGVDHEKLVSLATPLFEDMPIVKPPQALTSQYTGGQWRTQATSDKTHVAVAFEIPGGWRNEKNAIAATVLQTLLGGGGSFSSGGPGKGVHSRLYTRVLCAYSKVESFTAFSSLYNDSGLFGIQASSEPGFIPDLVDLMVREMHAVARLGKVTQQELDRAKNATISLVLMNLESRVVVAEDLGRQILAYGVRKPVQEFVNDVNALTLEDISNIAQAMISTPLTMASWGDVSKVPDYDEIAPAFGNPREPSGLDVDDGDVYGASASEGYSSADLDDDPMDSNEEETEDDTECREKH